MTVNDPNDEAETLETTATQETPAKKTDGVWAGLNRYRPAIVDWTQTIANLTIAVGLILAVGSYFYQQQSDNRDAAEKRMALFHSVSISAARTKLVRLWDGQNWAGLSQGMPRKAINALVNKAIDSRSESPQQIDEAILIIADYLDGLGSCRDSGYCDPDVLDRRLGIFGQDFYCTYKGRIEDLRERRLLPLLGRDLGIWVEKLGGCLVPPTEFGGSDGAKDS